MRINDENFESPKRFLPTSTVLPNFRSSAGLFDSKLIPQNHFSKSSTILAQNLSKFQSNKKSIDIIDNDEISKLKKDFEYFKHETTHENSKLTHELKELKEKHIDIEKKNMLLLNDLDKQALLLNEKTNEIDYWKNKFSNLEGNFSNQKSEQDKILRMYNDTNEVSKKWKEKYSEFEKIHLEQQNQFEALKIKYKRLEKKNELLNKELSDIKESLNRHEVSNNQLQFENDKLKKNFVDIEQKQQKYIEDIEVLKGEFDEYKANHDITLEETRDEGSKMIQNMHVSYQDILHKKLKAESQSKLLMDQMKEIMNKIQNQENIISEKENKLMEMGLKLNEAENQISQLNYQLSQKDQNLFKMKSEFVGYSNVNNNMLSGRSYNEGPGVKILEARIENQKTEIISLKKILEFNEKYKSNEKFIDIIKNKEKEYDLLKEKMRNLEAEKQDRKYDNRIEDLQIKIVLISSENERLHSVLKEMKHEQNSQNNNIEPYNHNIEFNPISQYMSNDNERLSARTKPFFENKSNFYSPTYRGEHINIHIDDTQLRNSRVSHKSSKNINLLKDYEESNKQLQELKNQLQDSLKKKENYFSQLKYPNHLY